MSFIGNRLESEGTDFWKLWVEHQYYLYQRCLSWMKGNSTDAQEALSRSSIKAWEKWQDYAGKITNPKAWMTRLTHNLCMDMHRERSREARGIEGIEEIATAEDNYVAFSAPSSGSTVLDRQRNSYLHRTINTLPAKVRIPFILWYEQEMSYSEIAQQLAVPKEKVRKRVQQGRTILKKQLKEYFSELDGSSPLATCSNLSLKKGVSRGASQSYTNNPILLPGTTPKEQDAATTNLPTGDAPVRSQEYQESDTPAEEEQFSYEFMKLALEKLVSEPITTSDCNTQITTGCTPESIDYKVTVTCLEVLSDQWYSSPSYLGWR